MYKNFANTLETIYKLKFNIKLEKTWQNFNDMVNMVTVNI